LLTFWFVTENKQVLVEEFWLALGVPTHFMFWYSKKSRTKTLFISLFFCDAAGVVYITNFYHYLANHYTMETVTNLPATTDLPLPLLCFCCLCHAAASAAAAAKVMLRPSCCLPPCCDCRCRRRLCCAVTTAAPAMMPLSCHCYHQADATATSNAVPPLRHHHCSAAAAPPPAALPPPQPPPC
jgi:hypothetical protein